MYKIYFFVISLLCFFSCQNDSIQNDSISFSLLLDSKTEDSINNMVENLKGDIDNQIPVLDSFKTSGGVHLRILIGYNDTEFIFFILVIVNLKDLIISLNNSRMF